MNNFNRNNDFSQNAFSSSVYSDYSHAMDDESSKPNKLAQSAYNPFQFVTRIPDNTAEATLLKSLTVSKNVKTINGEDLFVLVFGSRDKEIIRHYVADPTSKKYSFLDYISPDQQLTDNYDRARPTTAGIQIYSATTSGTLFNVQGSINATSVQRLPKINDMKFENIISNGIGNGNKLANVPIEKGACCLGMIQNFNEFLPFKTDNVFPVDSLIRLTAKLEDYNPLIRGAIHAFTANEYVWKITDLPDNTWGRIDVHTNFQFTATTTSFDVFETRVKSYVADPITGARIIKTEVQPFLMDAWGSGQTCDTTAHFNINEDVFEIGFYSAVGTTNQYGLNISFKPNATITLYDVYQNYSRGYASIIGTSNVSIGMTIGINASLNYEVIPNEKLNRETGEIQTSSDNTDDLEVMKIIYKKNKFKLNWVLSEYLAWIRQEQWEKSMSKGMLYASVWSDIKSIMKVASPILGHYIGGMLGSQGVGREVGNFMSEKVFSSTKKNLTYCSSAGKLDIAKKIIKDTKKKEKKNNITYASTQDVKQEVKEDVNLDKLPDFKLSLEQNFGVQPDMTKMKIEKNFEIDKQGYVRDTTIFVILMNKKKIISLYKNGKRLQRTFIKEEEETANTILKIIELDTLAVHSLQTLDKEVKEPRTAKVCFTLNQTADYTNKKYKKKSKNVCHASTKNEKLFDFEEIIKRGRTEKGKLINNEDGTVTFIVKYEDIKEDVIIEEKKKDEKRTKCSTTGEKKKDEFDDFDIKSLNEGKGNKYAQCSSLEVKEQKKEALKPEEDFGVVQIKPKKVEIKIPEVVEKVEVQKPQVNTTPTNWYKYDKPGVATFDKYTYPDALTDFNATTDSRKQDKLNHGFSGFMQGYVNSDRYPGYNIQKVVAIKNEKGVLNELYLSHVPLYQLSADTQDVLLQTAYHHFKYKDVNLYIDGAFMKDAVRQCCRVLNNCGIDYSKFKDVFITTKYSEEGVDGGSWGGAIFALLNQFPYGPYISCDLREKDQCTDGFTVAPVTFIARKAAVIPDGKQIITCIPNQESLGNISSVHSGMISTLTLRTSETSLSKVFRIQSIAELTLLCFVLSYKASSGEALRNETLKSVDSLLHWYMTNQNAPHMEEAEANFRANNKEFTGVQQYINVLQGLKDLKNVEGANIQVPKKIKSFPNVYDSIHSQLRDNEELGIRSKKEKMKKAGQAKVLMIDVNGQPVFGEDNEQKFEYIDAKEQVRRAKIHKKMRRGQFLSWEVPNFQESSERKILKSKQKFEKLEKKPKMKGKGVNPKEEYIF